MLVEPTVLALNTIIVFNTLKLLRDVMTSIRIRAQGLVAPTYCIERYER